MNFMNAFGEFACKSESRGSDMECVAVDYCFLDPGNSLPFCQLVLGT
jgi:hypothetical protein